ncbi:MAG TPA: c-type cytochrome [Chryseosolibacter sp.]
MNGDLQGESGFLRRVPLILSLIVICLSFVVGASGFYLFFQPANRPAKETITRNVAPAQSPRSDLWHAPDSTLIPLTPEGDLIRYGHDLIAHTADYLGPNGKVKATSNGMNCQNCHLKAGTKPFGNNYAAVASMYPRFRARSGGIETMEKRVNDCIERSLNGTALEEDSKEMRAMIAYFRWLGKDVQSGVTPKGAGLIELPLLERAADPAKGKLVYEKYCRLCHGAEGSGYRIAGSAGWKYPPLAGENSYNTGAGLLRLSRFAAYVKANMPNGTRYDSPVLTDEEAWDVAAYINSLPRPVKNFPGDWPDVAAKPFDHPFGPYADNFSEREHRYGPFAGMIKRKMK